jgi:hypothetical protein
LLAPDFVGAAFLLAGWKKEQYHNQETSLW